jgi:predicted Zn-dependent peptidase/outer membrane lipoprotein-sorting protein
MTRLYRFLCFSLAAFGLVALAAPPAAAQQPGDIRTAAYDVAELTYPDLPDFAPPRPERIELDNGLTVFLLEDPELPQVNAVARIGAGSVYEPAEKRGLASVTGTVMRTGGTDSMSPDSVNVVLENRGATVETSMGETSGSAFMSTLSDHVDTVLPVFADVIRSPAFDEAKLQQAKSQQKSVISRRNDNARQIASREFDKILYGEDSPYARTPEYYTIDRIERQDLVDFHDAYVQPNNVLLSVWGDFDADAMEEKLREQFGDWEAPDGFTPPTPPAPEANREYSVNVVQKSDVNQSTIYMGHPGEITRRSDDYAPVTLMNEVLSGGFSGRLFQQVRREKGLAYSVFGNYSAGYQQPGRFFAGVFSQSPTTVEATNAVMTEVERMRQEPPTDEELGLAKDSYLNSFVFNFDSEREILSRRMTYEAYDYPADFLQQTRDEIEDVTSDDVLSVAKQYLHPDESHILVVGNREAFSDSLSALTQDGSVNEVDISIPQTPPESQSQPTAADEEAMAAGQELMARAKEALGGAAFDDIENMRVVTNQQGNESTLVVQLPDQIRTELTTPMGSITVVDDGETMTMQTPQGTRTAPPSARGQVKGQLWRSLPYLMASLDREGLSFRAQGDTTIADTTYRAVQVQPPTGSNYTLHLHAETMRPERLSLEMVNPQSGATVQVQQSFRDFREIGGVTLPYTTHSVQSTAQGEQEVTATIETIEINTELEAGFFTLEESSGGGS